MRVIVCGGRHFNDWRTLRRVLGDLLAQQGIFNNIPEAPTVFIVGGAKGVDTMAKRYALDSNLEVIEMFANWDLYGDAAGPMRNRRMLEEGKPSLVVAFEGGKGTADMIRQAKRAGVRVIEIEGERSGY